MNIYKCHPARPCCSEGLNYGTNIYAFNGPFAFPLLLQIRTEHNSKIVCVRLFESIFVSKCVFEHSFRYHFQSASACLHVSLNLLQLSS